MVAFQSLTDLLSAPVWSDQVLDMLPGRLAHPLGAGMGAVVSKPLYLLGPVTSLATITVQLRAYFRRVCAKNSCNLRLVASSFHEHINLVSLFTGELCRSHRIGALPVSDLL